jgi:hypothetical protein
MKKNTPNFIIVGAMKGSTSAAAINLNLHEDVFCVTPYWKEKVNAHYNYKPSDFVGGLSEETNKEMDFFNKEHNFNLGRDLYESYFPRPTKAIGEASPNYFYLHEKGQESTAKNMALTLGTPKIIVILRDPITRSFSHWNHIQRPNSNFALRFKGKSFNESTEQVSNDKAKNSILLRSKYVENLKKYRATFGSENVYVAIQEEIKANPAVEYNKMFSFLGVDELALDKEYRDIHSASYDTTIDTASEQFLKAYFKDSVNELKALYPDLDYSKWNTY